MSGRWSRFAKLRGEWLVMGTNIDEDQAKRTAEPEWNEEAVVAVPNAVAAAAPDLLEALHRIASDDICAMLGEELADGEDIALCSQCGQTGETVETVPHDDDCPYAIARAAIARTEATDTTEGAE